MDSTFSRTLLAILHPIDPFGERADRGHEPDKAALLP
jgi:hypothetical protein